MKTIALLLIGILLGGAGGYFGHQYLTQPQLDQLESDVASLTVSLDQLRTDYNVLTTLNENSEGQLEALQEAYTELEAENTTLSEEHAELIEQFELLSEQYESLLDEYETTLGGLDFSNQTIPVIEKEYTWEYDGENYTIDISIPAALYNYYSVKERYTTMDYRGYLLHPYDDAYIDVLINEFDRLVALTELTEEDKLGLVCSFVQNMDYVQDSVTLEYPKYPIETLMDKGGDCEDTTILMGHLLHEMNISIMLIYMPNHMALGVGVNSTGLRWILDNETYSYMETTAKGWTPGDVPFEYQFTEYDLFPVYEEPYIAHTWTAERRNEDVTVTAKYTNDTPYDASGYRSWIGIELEDGNAYGKAGTLVELDFKESKTTTLRISGTRFATMRIIVGVQKPDGTIINKVYSEWFTTR